MSVGARAARQFGPAERPPPGRTTPERPPAPPSTARQVALGFTFVVAVVAAVLTWAQVVERLREPDPIATRGTPAAVVWSERVFRSEAELAAWLRRKGVDYETWARAHPAAVAILRKRDRAAVAASSAPRAQTSGAAAQRAPGTEPEAVARPADPAEAPGPGITPLVALAVIVTGVAAVAFGLSHRLRLGSAAAAAATGVVRSGPAAASLVPAAAARVPVAVRVGRRAGLVVAGVAPFLLGLARRIVLLAVAVVLGTLRSSRDLALVVVDRARDALRIARRAVVVAGAGATEALRLVRRVPVRRFWGVVSQHRLDLAASAIALSVGLVVAVLLR